jgi:hypothetical protein
MAYTPEDYTLQTWLAFEKMHNGEPMDEPPPQQIEPHPNEIATREAVEAGVYTAEHVGLAP